MIKLQVSRRLGVALPASFAAMWLGTACDGEEFKAYKYPTMPEVEVVRSAPWSTKVDTLMLSCRPLRREPPHRLWAQCDDGLAYSDGDGRDWSPATVRLPPTARRLAFEGSGPAWVLDADNKLWRADRMGAAWSEVPSSGQRLDTARLDVIRWDAPRQRLLAWGSGGPLRAVIKDGNVSWESLLSGPVRGDGLVFVVNADDDVLVAFFNDGDAVDIDLRKDQVSRTQRVGKSAVQWNRQTIVRASAGALFVLKGSSEVTKYLPGRPPMLVPVKGLARGQELRQLIWDDANQRLLGIVGSRWGTPTIIALDAGLGWKRLATEDGDAELLNGQEYLPIVDQAGRLTLVGDRLTRVRVGLNSFRVVDVGYTSAFLFGPGVRYAFSSEDGSRRALIRSDGAVVMTQNGGRSWEKSAPFERASLRAAADPSLDRLWVADGAEIQEFRAGGNWVKVPMSPLGGVDGLVHDQAAGLLYAYRDGNVAVWSQTRKTWRRLETRGQPQIRQLIALPDSKVVAVAADSLQVLPKNADRFDTIVPGLSNAPFQALGDFTTSYMAATVARTSSSWALWVIARVKRNGESVHREAVLRTRDLSSWTGVVPVNGFWGETESLLAVGKSESLVALTDRSALGSSDGGLSWHVVDTFEQAAYPRFDGVEKAPFFVGMEKPSPLDDSRTARGFLARFEPVKSTTPLLLAYRMVGIAGANQNQLDLQFDNRSCTIETHEAMLEYRLPGDVDFRRLLNVQSDVRDDRTVRLNFSLSRLALQPGNRFDLRVGVSCGGYSREAVFELGSYRVGTIADQVPGGWQTIGAIAALLLLPASALAAYALRPRWLLAARRVGWTTWTDALPSYLAWIPKLLLGTFLIPWLSRRPRVLDAWVRQYRGRFADLLEENATAQANRQAYVPFPLLVVSQGRETVIDKPTVRDLVGEAAARPCLIDIVGGGGAGKTRLCLEIVRTLAANDTAGILSVVPVWLDQSITDLGATLDAHLLAATGSKVDAGLREALVADGRLLIVVDRLSEQTQQTRTQLQRLWTEFNAGCVIVTRRDGGERLGLLRPSAVMRPQPLDQYTLPMFLAGFLSSIDTERVLEGVSEPSEIAAQLGRMTGRVERGSTSGTALTPLLVTMFASTALGHRRSHEPLSHLPSTLAEIYFAYVERLDAANLSLGAPLDKLVLRRLLVSLGALALNRDSLRVGEFEWQAALRLTSELTGEALQALVRMEQSGVLKTNVHGLNKMCRFQLDPMGEFFGLYAAAQACGPHDFQWEELATRIRRSGDRAPALLSLMRTIRIAYATSLGWGGAGVDWSMGGE